MNDYWCFFDSSAIIKLQEVGFKSTGFSTERDRILINITNRTYTFSNTIAGKVRRYDVDLYFREGGAKIFDHDELDELLLPFRRDNTIDKILEDE